MAAWGRQRPCPLYPHRLCHRRTHRAGAHADLYLGSGACACAAAAWRAAAQAKVGGAPQKMGGEPYPTQPGGEESAARPVACRQRHCGEPCQALCALYDPLCCAETARLYGAHLWAGAAACRADAAHHKSIRNAHSGVRKTPSELRAIADIIEPLIAKGQSLNHICATHLDELGISERTLYNYIDQGVFKVRNIDLPKKVVYRQRRPKKVLTKLEYQYRQGRTYEDFKSFMEANPDLPVVEMDTVKGGRNKGKVFLTMIFRRTSFMLIFLMNDGTQDSVIQIFDSLTEILGVSLFKRLFPVILTDIGVEFKNPQALEHTRTWLSRTRVFFCDSQASWQKPQVENNHRLIRRILPKGVSFSPLTVADVTLICCHINSVLRENLDNKTPFDLMDSKDGKKLLSLLQLSPIPPDEVTLSPKLLKR